MNSVNHKIPPAFTDEVYAALEKFDRRIYFHWDLTQDILKVNTSTPDTSYDLPELLSDASTQLWLAELIHPEDVFRLRLYLHSIFHRPPRYANGTRNHSCKLRLYGRKQHSYVWSEIHIITYFDGHRPVAAFGNIRNIQAQKLWQQRIEQEASHDKLTGLLNKDATQTQISTVLSTMSPQHDQAALLLIDADGFKNINDSFGHLFGDAVLTDIGKAIEHNFRQSDLKGRVGGDEFVVFLPNSSDVNIIKIRCEQLLTQLKRDYTNGDSSLPFSVSIGISQYPEHGITYTNLFKHADRALYESKSMGRSRYTIYQNSLFGSNQSTSQRNPDAFADLQQKAFNDNMIECIFMLLYETNSPETTTELSIGMFGKRFNLDRVSIDGFDHDTNQYTNRYEWLSPRAVSLRQQNHEENIADLITAHNNLVLSQYKPTPYGVMSICPDSSVLEAKYQAEAQTMGLKSFAHCLISHGTDTLGCVGFESSQPQEFSQEIISSLSIFSVILGNILLPHDSDASIKQENEHLRDILNHMQEMIYIVDKITMKPLYYNQAIRQLVSSSSNQYPCYHLFHNRDSLCPDCPVRKLSGEGSEYIDTTLDNWIAGTPVHTRACNLCWGDEKSQPLAMVVQEPF
ncbi:MAG: GGDEF domain-containing protein [Selenomonas sp.]|jgi:diguanylate cyclase (GGDEF)-like protein|nr:GGDEF domain-containing protein [Selenomonas sp.]